MKILVKNHFQIKWPIKTRMHACMLLEPNRFCRPWCIARCGGTYRAPKAMQLGSGCLHRLACCLCCPHTKAKWGKKLSLSLLGAEKKVRLAHLLMLLKLLTWLRWMGAGRIQACLPAKSPNLSSERRCNWWKSQPRQLTGCSGERSCPDPRVCCAWPCSYFATSALLSNPSFCGPLPVVSTDNSFIPAVSVLPPEAVCKYLPKASSLPAGLSAKTLSLSRSKIFKRL